MKRIFFATVSIYIFMSLFTFSSAEEITVGTDAPAFELFDQQETLQKLDNYRGKWVVLYLYPKDDTPGCTKEACEFRYDIAVLQNMNVQVFGLSVDDIKSHAKFAKKYSLQFPLLSDPDGLVANRYGSLTKIGPLKLAKRHTFVIDPEGKIAKIYRDVKPATHSDEVIEALKQLQN